MVSAWANKNQLVLGQQKVDDKSNEINAELIENEFVRGVPHPNLLQRGIERFSLL